MRDTTTTVVAIFLMCGSVLLFAGARAASHSKSEAATQSFRARMLNAAQDDADRVSRMIEIIHDDLCTMARLPSAAKLDRLGREVDPASLSTFREIAHAMSSRASVSEVYIVAADMDPDAIEPETGEFGHPIISLAERPAASGHTADPAATAAELHELRLIRHQLAEMRTRWPDRSNASGRRLPMLSGPEVPSCSRRGCESGLEEDQACGGLVISVPFYGEDDQLKGCMSAVVLRSAVQDLLPSSRHALRIEPHGVTIMGRNNQIELSPAERSALAACVPAPGAVFSTVIDLPRRDRAETWKLWVSLHDSAFAASNEHHSAAAFAAACYGSALLGSVMLCGAASLLLGSQRRRSAQREQLEQAVLARTVELTESHRHLERALAAAEKAGQAKTDFLTNMSHELRTPMTAILGFADLLTTPGLSEPERAEFLANIRRSGRHLLSLINDVLDVSRIETGELSIRRTRVSPIGILEECLSLLRPQLAGRSVTLEGSFELPTPETIETDGDRLRQVLLNIGGNAAKFTTSGSITIRMSFEPGPAPAMRYEIRDTGPGIAPEMLAALYEPFRQADGSARRRHGGLGIGLSLSRRLIEQLGGTLSASSTLGQGSCFVVKVPTGPLEGVAMREQAREGGGMLHAQAKSSDTQPLQNRRILFVEDGPDNRRLVCFHLKKAGAEVETAENGRVGHEAALAAARAGTPYDVVFMDMQMPEMDGYAATSLLRAEGYQRPIVALTAHAMPGDRERCLAAGCDDYLTKPIDRIQLIEAAQRWTRPTGGKCDRTGKGG